MDIGVTASMIINKALLLKNGGTIVVPCSSYEEMERLRTRLYKVKNKLDKEPGSLAQTLDITRSVRKEKWIIYVSKETELEGVLIIEEGEARPFNIKDEEEKEEMIRRDRLMQEDMKEVELKEDLKEAELPRDFNSVAAEIEADQNLIPEELKIDLSEEEDKI